MKRVDELISKLENDLHIEFLGSRRAEAKRIIVAWVEQFNVREPKRIANDPDVVSSPAEALKAKREILDPLLTYNQRMTDAVDRVLDSAALTPDVSVSNIQVPKGD